jgi:hypothetical protein
MAEDTELKSPTGKMFIIWILIAVVMGLTLMMCGMVLYQGFASCAGAALCEASFKSMAVTLIFFWAGLLVCYYLWAIFFYNVNYGLTDFDWEDLAARRKLAAQRRMFAAEGEVATIEGSEKELDENPYRHETFGLPPGTVRGTIAITILVGGLGMLILAIGQGDTELKNFNFFSQAFMMMIAFYFGTKGLDILQKAKTGEGKDGEDEKGHGDIPKPPIKIGLGQSPVATPQPQIPSAPGKTTGLLIPAATPVSGMVPVGLMTVSAPTVASGHPIVDHSGRFNKAGRHLTSRDIEEQAREIGIDPCALGAVIKVESGSKGFLTDGRPKILFEGHIFWRQLKKAGKAPETFAAEHPDIVYPRWVKTFYKGGIGEYERLGRAMLIDEEAALMSTSWGMFQIMGFNHMPAGFDTVKEFVDAHHASEREHLRAFCDFIREGGMIQALLEKDWAAFAAKYNGAGYKANAYDVKMAAAYDNCVKLGVFNGPGSVA